MRKLIVLAFTTLDGVMQAPGGPGEDTSGGFRYGGWVFPFFDDALGEEMDNQMGHDFELLLGRRTYQIFADYWPLRSNEEDSTAAALNKARKYVVSRTLEKAEWNNSVIISDNVPDRIRQLKAEDGPELQVHGSTNLIQTLWSNDLADELWLKIFPVVVGTGKRLFDTERFAGRFELVRHRISPSGVIVAYYRRSGGVETGSF